MKGFCSLASGSKGNCIYIGSEESKILVDMGLSVKAANEKLSQLSLSLEDIDAILITHEHMDHIAGLKTLLKKYAIPLITNQETAKALVKLLGFCPKFKIFSTGEPFSFRDIEVYPFTIQHDTPDPVAFTFTVEGRKVGVCTDLGQVTTLVEGALRGCNLLYLEANHEPSMVHACARPMVYKQRVLSRTGHLSNEDAGKLLLKLFHEDLEAIYLAHLSEECNTPEVALRTIVPILNREGYVHRLRIAPQTQISEPFLFL